MAVSLLIENEAFAATVACVGLCELLGLCGESDDGSLSRTAVHEAGHAFVCLLEGVNFARVEVTRNPGAIDRGMLILPNAPDPRLPGSALSRCGSPSMWPALLLRSWCLKMLNPAAPGRTSGSHSPASTLWTQSSRVMRQA